MNTEILLDKETSQVRLSVKLDGKDVEIPLSFRDLVGLIARCSTAVEALYRIKDARDADQKRRKDYGPEAGAASGN